MGSGPGGRAPLRAAEPPSPRCRGGPRHQIKRRTRNGLQANNHASFDDRGAALGAQIERAFEQRSRAPVVYSLVALRGIDKLAAMVLLAKLGNIDI
jgi:hypothetical protein